MKPTSDSSMPMGKEPTLTAFGGKVTCPRCQAKSKRSGEQCRKPAMKGKAVCRTHGGKSQGPTTVEGRQRCAAARTTHGQETTAMRKARSEGIKRLRDIEDLAIAWAVMSGPRTSGRKPKTS